MYRPDNTKRTPNHLNCGTHHCSWTIIHVYIYSSCTWTQRPPGHFAACPPQIMANLRNSREPRPSITWFHYGQIHICNVSTDQTLCLCPFSLTESYVCLVSHFSLPSSAFRPTLSLPPISRKFHFHLVYIHVPNLKCIIKPYNSLFIACFN